MKHVVFIIGSYHPHYSAVGNCVEKVISLLKSNFRISVIAAKNSSELKQNSMFDGYNIRRIETSYQKERNYLSSPNFKFNFFRKLKILEKRIVNLLKFLARRESIDPALVDCYLSELNELHEVNNIDVLIPVVFPFEAVIAAISFKKKISPNCILLPYLFDNFSKSVSLHRFNFNRSIKFKNNRKLEILMLEMATKVFAMHPLQNHFDSVAPVAYLPKISYVEHPLLVNRNFNPVVRSEKKITFTYTGALIRGVRSSNGCLAFLAALSKEMLISVSFYCYGSDLNAINHYSKANSSTFCNYGKVKKNVADDAINSSDILISIGDVEGSQISSKIFDYLSMGKPVMHFSYLKDCVNSRLLKRYPLAYIVLLNSDDYYSESIIKEALSFAEKVKGTTMTFTEVSRLYPTALPTVTAALFRNCINQNCTSENI
jgi:hypothetical protein